MFASWTDGFDLRSVSSLYTRHCVPDVCFAGVSSPVYEFCHIFARSHVLCVQAIGESLRFQFCVFGLTPLC